MTTTTKTRSKLKLELPPKLIPVFAGQADVRGAFGGRGSSKTRTFAKMAAVRGLMFAEAGISGLIVCGREFQNSLAESSFAEVKAAIESEPWLAENYEVGEKYIRTRCGRVVFAFIGLRRSLNSIKSRARILILWVDEAEPITEYAWQLAIPTIREEGSELWVTWNPEREGTSTSGSATDYRFRKTAEPDWKIVEINWRDNPWFPQKLNRTRLRDKRRQPEDYNWIWQGAYRTHYAGAYYSKHLLAAEQTRRVGIVDLEPLMGIRTYHDLAGASDRADNYVIWVAQFVDKEIRVLAHYETAGQAPQFHIQWLRSWCLDRGIKRCHIGLPHDGTQVQIDQSWQNIWRRAGDEDVKFDVPEPIRSGGRGAAMDRVRASQMHFHRVRFNSDTTGAGRLALAAYHEKRSEDERNVGLGPEHDWASHTADAFGLMCVDYSERKGKVPLPEDKYRKRKRARGSSWSS
jgi:phage terminase large subunit